MSSILSINRLTKNYKKLVAVNNLSFTIQKGQVLGLLGPNGSGKSTTLGMILNVVNKTSGDFTWFDGELTTSQALKRIGAIIERPNFYPYMTAYQNLELVCKIKEIDNSQILEKLEMVDLLDRKDDKFKTFSLGMKQRLAIASALLNNPEMLILDEPTNGLDPKGIHEIRAIIKEIAKKGTTIILASHLLDEVEKVCDYVIILEKGKKIYEGKVQDLSLNKHWFEIGITDKQNCIEALQSHNAIKNVSIDKDIIIVRPNHNVSGSKIVKYLSERDIYLDSIIKKYPSLEELFLSITQ